MMVRVVGEIRVRVRGDDVRVRRRMWSVWMGVEVRGEGRRVVVR
jgi:hypothetical protein